VPTFFFSVGYAFNCRNYRCRFLSSERASIAFGYTPMQLGGSTRTPLGRTHLIKKARNTMKTERLNLRISSENLAVVRHKAKKANMTLTDYVTKVAMGKEIVIITDLAEVLRELKAVGRNLNQLATLSNMGRVQAVNLTETLECFTQINQSLQEILERRRWSA